MYVLPHCSTGGMPQYVVRQVQNFRNDYDITVVETANIDSDHFTVQKDKLKALCNYKCLYNQQDELIKLVQEVSPDIIHFQEVPEDFLEDRISKQLFTPSRKYFILTTTHSSTTDPRALRFLPDRFVLVNRWSENVFKEARPEIPTAVWEYPIENLSCRLSKEAAREMLNFSSAWRWSDYEKHILNVGLFTPGKNQGELFEVARQNPQNLYHFVGNQAGNFQFYWGPIMMNKPDNCIIWGERADVDLFYQACDEFYFTSKFELNPLVVKEALSYGVPVKMYRLPTYLDDYDNNPLVTYL